MNESESHSSDQVENPYQQSAGSFQEPPRTFRGTLKHLGPGMILVGSIVGSGELIMTTKLGAETGFLMLWFLLLSCFIKVVVQAELVRYTISSGKTFLEVYNTLPGFGHRRPAWLTTRWLVLVLIGFLVGVFAYRRLDDQSWVFVVPVAVIIVLIGAAVRISHQEKWRQSSERPRINWFMWVYLVSVLLMYINGGAG